MTEPRDQETRERLLTAGRTLFAERGFAKVTVRDICQRANANVAAINYHFAGKDGLYRQIVQAAIEPMRATTALAQKAGAGKTPAERLHAYVVVFVQRVIGSGPNSDIHQLMLRELSDPTPALDMVIDQVIRPRMEYLGQIVAALLECAPDDPRVGPCAMSVHAQCMALMNVHVGERMDPSFRLTPERLLEAADHITRFSLGGIAAAKG